MSTKIAETIGWHNRKLATTFSTKKEHLVVSASLLGGLPCFVVLFYVRVFPKHQKALAQYPGGFKAQPKPNESETNVESTKTNKIVWL